VTAFCLILWLEDELEDDYGQCLAVCQQLGVPLEMVSLLQQQYKAKVISYAAQEAESGQTPNPNMLCNSCFKFGCFTMLSPTETLTTLLPGTMRN
jgi:tRNA U34 2-thiouridine synthase MnmA/TrmU